MVLSIPLHPSLGPARQLVVCRAGLGPNAPAWAGLGRARAHKNVEPGPGRRLGLGWAGLGLKPGLWSGET